MNKIRLASDNYTFFFVSVANMLRKEHARAAFIEAIANGTEECVIHGTYFGSLKIDATDLIAKHSSKILICNLSDITSALSNKIALYIGGELNTQVRIEESGYIFEFEIKSFGGCEGEIFKLKELLLLEQDSAIFHRNVQLKISVS